MSLLRRILNRIRRPSAVTSAQHRHVQRNPACVACGSMRSVQAHHVAPWNLFPELGADPNNFISLCESETECHLLIGHGGNFKFYNPDVVDDARWYRGSNDVARRLLLDRIRSKRLVDAA